MGRLVINHSTNLKGLIPFLKKLATRKGIKTITPGVITNIRGNRSKISLHISTGIKGGYKVLAKNGRSLQEVFIITDLGQDEIETLLNKI